MKAKTKDWQSRLVGRRVSVNTQLDFPPKAHLLDTGWCYYEGTLCDYIGDGNGWISRVLVAFSPDIRRELPVDRVKLVEPISQTPMGS